MKKFNDKFVLGYYSVALILFIFFLAIFGGCSTQPRKVYIPKKPKKEQFKPRRDLKMECVEKLIKMDVKPLDSSEICLNVYKREE